MQNYMFLGLKSPCKAIFSLHFVKMALSAFAILAGLVASGSVFLNDLYFWTQSSYYINPYLCFMAFLLAFGPGLWGLAVVIFLLPLSAGLGTQLNAYLATQFLILPNAGLDLVAGFFLGSALREISKASSFLSKNRAGYPRTLIKELVPWPIALVIVMITISTAIAISRNVYQSAAATSFKGLLFNLVHFRPIGWHDDYMPISDWVAYALASAMIILVISCLKDSQHKNQIIFRPIVASLIAAAFIGVLQSITGTGLPESLLSFRRDFFGYAVIGLQPDLHAFAGHMLLGAVGLWGYFYSGLSRFERRAVLLAVVLSWIGLVLSKSRALLLIGILAVFFWFIWYLWKRKRRFVLPAVLLVGAAAGTFILFIFNNANNLSGIPVLSWLGELANEFKSRDLTSWSLLSGIFGSRFEIWEAALRMWWEFPLMGIGQGNFYRLSDIASFSKSHFLILNHGENAHNYFLQTLTETGVIGVLIFTILLLAPFFGIKERKLLLPAFVAILSLFFGNIFSHSFLVRENLLLAAAFMGLMMSICESNRLKMFNSVKSKYFQPIALVILIASALSTIEVYRSFGRSPFTRGFACHIESRGYSDGWTSGDYIIEIPVGAKGFTMDLEVNKLSISDGGLDISIEGPDESSIMRSKNNTVISKEGSYEINYYLSSNLKNDSQSNKVKLKVSSCFTPRNSGISVDARRLGVIIKKIQFID